MFDFLDATLVDLSIGIEDGAASEPDPVKLYRMDHREGAEWLAENLRATGQDVSADDFPDGTALAWPSHSKRLDYEVEIADVVGKRSRDIPAEDAARYLAGYTVFHDFSSRDTQMEEMEGKLEPAKGKDSADALGPYLVTPDAFDLESATVNDETWSEGVAGEMHHSFADIVTRVSCDETLYPGDVLGSGNVGGGSGLELGRFLESGDTVRLSVEGLGRWRTR